MKFRITPRMGEDGKLVRHMTLMPGVKFEDLTVKDMIGAEKIFKSLFEEDKKRGKSSLTPIGNQAGKDDTFFKSKNMGFGYGAGTKIKK
ncbi:hypothetical protein KA005_68250 [bacterium]|nr:hypothetical protein [bacterium]